MSVCRRVSCSAPNTHASEASLHHGMTIAQSASTSASLHVDVVFHPARGSAELATTELSVFVRSANGGMRSLGRALVPALPGCGAADPQTGAVSVEVRVRYDAWDTVLLVGLGAIALPVLQVRGVSE
jgi:hypothetical protein